MIWGLRRLSFGLEGWCVLPTFEKTLGGSSLPGLWDCSGYGELSKEAAENDRKKTTQRDLRREVKKKET